jgi:hypothetical protein
MPYEIVFQKMLPVADEGLYISDCCFGGDVVCDTLLPALERRYDAPLANQEEWGWRLRMETGGVDLAVDVFCEDAFIGDYKLQLTSRVSGNKGTGPLVDLPQLDALRDTVVAVLTAWLGTAPGVVRLDAAYQPVARYGAGRTGMTRRLPKG